MYKSLSYYILLMGILLVFPVTKAMEERENNNQTIQQTKQENPSEILSLKALIACSDPEKFFAQYPYLDLENQLAQLDGDHYDQVIQDINTKLRAAVPQEIHPCIMWLALQKYYPQLLHCTTNKRRYIAIDINKKTTNIYLLTQYKNVLERAKNIAQQENNAKLTKLENTLENSINQCLILIAAVQSVSSDGVEKIYQNIKDKQEYHYLLKGIRQISEKKRHKEYKKEYKKECAAWDASWRGKLKRLAYPITGIGIGVISGVMSGYVLGKALWNVDEPFHLFFLLHGYIAGCLIGLNTCVAITDKIDHIHHQDSFKIAKERMCVASYLIAYVSTLAYIKSKIR